MSKYEWVVCSVWLFSQQKKRYFEFYISRAKQLISRALMISSRILRAWVSDIKIMTWCGNWPGGFEWVRDPGTAWRAQNTSNLGTIACCKNSKKCHHASISFWTSSDHLIVSICIFACIEHTHTVSTELGLADSSHVFK